MELIPWFKLQWDRIVGAVLVVLGAVVLVAGWIGASGEVYIANQLPYLLSGGLGGLALIGVGATLWLSADLSDEWRTLDRLDSARATESDAALANRVRELELHVSHLSGLLNGAAQHERVRT
ncbi:hypothetical protein GCM10009547_00120 [Sporichthya brevicatena]|mgnify:CR=1 FL=1|uniref:Uncharacterized protein n=1 Tax=Sporichthya brevicatena TaxID=171442 RepID=A0ABN1G2B2_9ACTN